MLADTHLLTLFESGSAAQPGCWPPPWHFLSRFALMWISKNAQAFHRWPAQCYSTWTQQFITCTGWTWRTSLRTTFEKSSTISYDRYCPHHQADSRHLS